MKRRQFLAFSFLYAASLSEGNTRDGDAPRRLAIIHPSEPASNLTKNGRLYIRNIFTRLESLGYIEGKNLEVSRYSAMGSTEKLRELVNVVVESRPDVILAISGKTVSRLKTLTSTIPIVGMMSDPTAYGLVTSLSHPGGNITGASVDPGIDIWVKRMALLKEAVPNMSRVFFVAPDSTWTTAVGVGVKAAAEKSSVELVGPPVEDPHQEADYIKAFAGVSKHADAILVSSAAENVTWPKLIVELARDSRLPALYPYRRYVTEGGLMAHDLDDTDIWNRIADQISSIFKGARPGDLPIYQPRHFNLIINMRAANAIGFQFNQTMIAMADEVID